MSDPRMVPGAQLSYRLHGQEGHDRAIVLTEGKVMITHIAGRSTREFMLLADWLILAQGAEITVSGSTYPFNPPFLVARKEAARDDLSVLERACRRDVARYGLAALWLEGSACHKMKKAFPEEFYRLAEDLGAFVSRATLPMTPTVTTAEGWVVPRVIKGGGVKNQKDYDA